MSWPAPTDQTPDAVSEPTPEPTDTADEQPETEAEAAATIAQDVEEPQATDGAPAEDAVAPPQPDPAEAPTEGDGGQATEPQDATAEPDTAPGPQPAADEAPTSEAEAPAATTEADEAPAADEAPTSEAEAPAATTEADAGSAEPAADAPEPGTAQAETDAAFAATAEAVRQGSGPPQAAEGDAADAGAPESAGQPEAGTAQAETDAALTATAEDVADEAAAGDAAAGDAADAAPGAAEGEAKAPQQKKPKPKQEKKPEVRPEDVVRRIGDTNEKALRYVLDPDPKLSRLSRKVREALLTEIPPVTAGALLGPDALARHFVASAASGRYRDLFALWDLFRARPEDCKPVLAERPQALAKGRDALGTAVRLGLRGHAERVAEDVTLAQGLIWQWLREILSEQLPAVGRRPLIAAALLRREPGLEVPLPADPDDRWLAEAAAARQDGPLPDALDALLAQHVDRLPATVATLSLAHENYPERVSALLDRVDLGSPEIQAIVAWARDHGLAEQLRERIRRDVEAAAGTDRAAGLAQWYAWRERGVELPLPEAVRSTSVDDLDLTKPETGELIARLVADGADLQPQRRLDDLASQNRQLAEKAYEAFVCAGLDVALPAALVGNPIVKEGTRCPYCAAWTWVRPGHERRCPRRPADAPTSAQAPAEQPTPPPPAPAPAPTPTVDPAAEWEAQLRDEQA